MIIIKNNYFTPNLIYSAYLLKPAHFYGSSNGTLDPNLIFCCYIRTAHHAITPIVNSYIRLPNIPYVKTNNKSVAMFSGATKEITFASANGQ
jgi:hypothetical protein